MKAAEAFKADMCKCKKTDAKCITAASAKLQEAAKKQTSKPSEADVKKIKAILGDALKCPK